MLDEGMVGHRINAKKQKQRVRSRLAGMGWSAVADVHAKECVRCHRPGAVVPCCEQSLLRHLGVAAASAGSISLGRAGGQPQLNLCAKPAAHLDCCPAAGVCGVEGEAAEGGSRGQEANQGEADGKEAQAGGAQLCSRQQRRQWRQQCRAASRRSSRRRRSGSGTQAATAAVRRGRSWRRGGCQPTQASGWQQGGRQPPQGQDSLQEGGPGPEQQLRGLPNCWLLLQCKITCRWPDIKSDQINSSRFTEWGSVQLREPGLCCSTLTVPVPRRQTG